MRRRLLIAPVILVLAVSGVFLWRLHNRGPGKPSFNSAIDRFRTSSTVEGRTTALQPPPGVYTYTGSGSEDLSFMATHQPQGPKEPGTVTLEPNGCWTFAMDYNSFHRQTWTRCASHGRLVETGGTTKQQFDFVAFKQSEHSTITCTPPMIVADPAAKPGTSHPVHCTGHSATTGTNITQTGTMTYVGPDTVVVAAEAVAALHVRADLEVAGDQNGSSHYDLWYRTSDMLPLKEQHEIRVTSPAPAPLNNVTYTEKGNWQLASLTPRR